MLLVLLCVVWGQHFNEDTKHWFFRKKIKCVIYSLLKDFARASVPSCYCISPSHWNTAILIQAYCNVSSLKKKTTKLQPSWPNIPNYPLPHFCTLLCSKTPWNSTCFLLEVSISLTSNVSWTHSKKVYTSPSLRIHICQGRTKYIIYRVNAKWKCGTPCSKVYLFSRAILTNYHKLSYLKQ